MIEEPTDIDKIAYWSPEQVGEFNSTLPPSIDLFFTCRTIEAERDALRTALIECGKEGFMCVCLVLTPEQCSLHPGCCE